MYRKPFPTLYKILYGKRKGQGMSHRLIHSIGIVFRNTEEKQTKNKIKDRVGQDLNWPLRKMAARILDRQGNTTAIDQT